MRSAIACAAVSALAVLMGLPCAASASEVNIHITGVATAGSSGNALIYSTSSQVQASFVGDPVNLWLSVDTTNPAAYKVTSFSASWGNSSGYSPFIYDHMSADSSTPTWNADETEFNINLFNQAIALSTTGGSASLTGNDDFMAALDGDFALNALYALSSPHNINSSFSDSAASGSGNIQIDLIDIPSPAQHDISSTVNFDITGFAQTFVPEPATWAMLICGVAMIGGALRRRRNGAAVAA